MLIAFLFQKGMRPFLIRSWLLGLAQKEAGTGAEQHQEGRPGGAGWVAEGPLTASHSAHVPVSLLLIAEGDP